VRIGAKNLKFYVDSGCSKHMTGEPTNFVNIKPINRENVVFGDNNKGKIIDISDEFVEMMDSLNLDGEEKLEESKEVNPSENDDQVPIVETTQEQQSELPKD
ncbi:hypothetical protein PIB30_110266, partial [Stylosanthes scabra]|nr:hypothetical protein [Stylosanthes scabra]